MLSHCDLFQSIRVKSKNYLPIRKKQQIMVQFILQLLRSSLKKNDQEQREHCVPVLSRGNFWEGDCDPELEDRQLRKSRILAKVWAAGISFALSLMLHFCFLHKGSEWVIINACLEEIIKI